MAQCERALMPTKAPSSQLLSRACVRDCHMQSVLDGLAPRLQGNWWELMKTWRFFSLNSFYPYVVIGMVAQNCHHLCFISKMAYFSSPTSALLRGEHMGLLVFPFSENHWHQKPIFTHNWGTSVFHTPRGVMPTSWQFYPGLNKIQKYRRANAS